MPVSYTHLDVYKRQSLSTACRRVFVRPTNRQHSFAAVIGARKDGSLLRRSFMRGEGVVEAVAEFGEAVGFLQDEAAGEGEAALGEGVGGEA